MADRIAWTWVSVRMRSATDDDTVADGGREAGTSVRPTGIGATTA
jgi:hypothetical protein